MKHVLVTGSSGTIGTRLCERLLREGYHVTGVDRLPNRWNSQVDSLTIVGDLCHEETVGSLPDSPDAVVHLAANARVHNLVLDPLLACENVRSTFAALEFCRRNSIKRFLFASSREVYGNVNGMKRCEDETHVDTCESPYTASKFSGEALASAYERCYGIRCIVTRFSNVYGMYDASDRLIPLFIKRARQNRDLVVYGPNKILDFTHVDDTVEGIYRCIQRFDCLSEKTFNIATGRGTSITAVAEMIKERVGSASPIVLRDNRAGEVVQFVADVSAAREHLGYEPSVTIEEGLSKALAWYPCCEHSDCGLDKEPPTPIVASGKTARLSHRETLGYPPLKGHSGVTL